MFNKFTRKIAHHFSSNCLGYDDLESRKLLAVTTMLDGSNLNVELTQAGDIAVLDLVDDAVTINGMEIDTDSETEGIQAAGLSDITGISFSAADGVMDAAVQLNGDFNDGSLGLLFFTGIHEVTLNGNYSTEMLLGVFVGDDGSFTGDGQLQVATFTDISSNDDFDVTLSSAANDFMGQISVQSGGRITLQDSNDMVLGDIDVDSLILTAGGTISDTADSTITVAFETNLNATAINLGNQGNEVDLFVVITNTPGDFSLSDTNSIIWGNVSTAGSANVTAAETIMLGRFADVTIIGDGAFVAQSIRLGIGGSNTFNAGRINVNSAGNAFVWENSSLEIFGANQVANLDLIVTGDITNSADAQINVTGITSVQTGASVSLGNALNDSFNSGFLQFFANNVDISEDSNTVISGLANFAVDLRIQSNGMIVDTFDAFIFIQENGTFVSQGDEDVETGVNLGDTENDFFVAGSVSFSVNNFGLFVLNENDGTIIESPNGFVNTAEAIRITSAQDIVNAFASIIDIRTTAVLAADNITIGQSVDDNIQFGSMTLTTAIGGNATVVEDSDAFLTGTSNIGGDLIVSSLTGTVLDSNTSILNVAGQASFFAVGDIVIGDLPAPADDMSLGDIFDAGSLRFFSGGEVEITQNGDIVLAGMSHQAMNANLNATGNLDDMGEVADVGTITNEDNAEIQVTGNFFVTAVGDISLGNQSEDVVNFDNLNFNSLGTVDIDAIFDDEEDALFIFGTDNNPNQADQFILNTNVDVFDGTFAVIDIESFLSIDARNITLGDTDTDCLMYPEGSVFNTTDQAPNVSPSDESCPA